MVSCDDWAPVVNTTGGGSIYNTSSTHLPFVGVPRYVAPPYGEMCERQQDLVCLQTLNSEFFVTHNCRHPGGVRILETPYLPRVYKPSTVRRAWPHTYDLFCRCGRGPTRWAISCMHTHTDARTHTDNILLT